MQGIISTAAKPVSATEGFEVMRFSRQPGSMVSADEPCRHWVPCRHQVCDASINVIPRRPALLAFAKFGLVIGIELSEVVPCRRLVNHGR